MTPLKTDKTQYSCHAHSDRCHAPRSAVDDHLWQVNVLLVIVLVAVVRFVVRLVNIGPRTLALLTSPNSPPPENIKINILKKKTLKIKTLTNNGLNGDVSGVYLLGELPDSLVRVLVGVRVHVGLASGERVEQGNVTRGVGVDDACRYNWFKMSSPTQLFMKLEVTSPSTN